MALRATAIGGGKQRHTLEFRVPAEGRDHAAGDGLLCWPLAESKSFQGIVARHSDLLSRRSRTVPGRADVTGERHSRFRDGLAATREQGDRHAATFGRLRAADFRAMREYGATWKIITEDVPEPKGIGMEGKGS